MPLCCCPCWLPCIQDNEEATVNSAIVEHEGIMVLSAELEEQTTKLEAGRTTVDTIVTKLEAPKQKCNQDVTFATSNVPLA
ncbi:hypothetical protein LOK49_LG13G01536 [Camellia lanceoleosa]|uniref:Uncharacterized protein n=1 Tax=Camellia lanceoleosa TaxID=1840588 RepID=A0ACC0FNH3_9ERIC|nr:hypothetical protein LOK49_LG13G01536 [Camellia lanceoleosa]